MNQGWIFRFIPKYCISEKFPFLWSSGKSFLVLESVLIFLANWQSRKENPSQLTICLSWERFPIIYPFPDKKTGPDLGNFSQLKVMEPSILLLTFPGLFYLHKIKSFSNLDFFQIGKYFQLMLSLLVKITCTDQ